MLTALFRVAWHHLPATLAAVLALLAGAASRGQAQSTPSCPCTLWAPSAVPALVSDVDTSAVELGVKFRSNLDGIITGIRFYKGPLNTGPHLGNLWTSTGQLLASVTFTNENW
jgi:hypothetical protein